MDYKIPDLEKLEWQKPIENRFLTGPPTPVKGKRYIVASPATGDWVGQENNIAIYNGSTWDFIVKKEGMKLWDKNENLFLHYDGTAWIPDIILYQTVAEFLDQYQTNFDDDYSFGELSVSPYLFAQTFKASRTGTLTKAILKCYIEEAASNNLTVTVRTVDESGVPTGTILATSTILAANIPVGESGVDIDIIFSSPASVITGTTYALVFSSAQTDINFCLKVAGNSGGSGPIPRQYAYGLPYTWTGATFGTISSPWMEFYFKIYITIPTGELINNGLLKKDLTVSEGVKIDGYDVSALGAVSHDPKILGTKEIDESGIGNNKVIIYDEDSEKLVYRVISKVFSFFIS